MFAFKTVNKVMCWGSDSVVEGNCPYSVLMSFAFFGDLFVRHGQNCSETAARSALLFKKTRLFPYILPQPLP